MKNKYLISLSLSVFVFGIVSSASATTTPYGRPAMEAKRAEMKEKRVEFQKDIAKRKVENVSKVITATIERLGKIIERIESRIAKLKSAGGNTAESERFVALAKTDLEMAKVSVAAFASIDLSSDKAQENFERIRTAAAEAREHIRSAHENLMKAVRLLGQVNSSLKTASSTKEQ